MHEWAALWEHQDPSGNGGWWMTSFAKLPESLFSVLQMIAYSEDDLVRLGAFDQP